MRQPPARYSAPVSFVHALSLADFITTIVGFEVFGTHRRRLPFSGRGRQPNRSHQEAERRIVAARVRGGFFRHAIVCKWPKAAVSECLLSRRCWRLSGNQPRSWGEPDTSK